MDYEIGTRVLAIRNTDDATVYAYGYGTYVGDEVPPTDDEDVILFFREFGGNPKIVLDNGDVVWGFQCWWGEATYLEEQYREHEFVIVPVPDYNERGVDLA